LKIALYIQGRIPVTDNRLGWRQGGLGIGRGRVDNFARRQGGCRHIFQQYAVGGRQRDQCIGAHLGERVVPAAPVNAVSSEPDLDEIVARTPCYGVVVGTTINHRRARPQGDRVDAIAERNGTVERSGRAVERRPAAGKSHISVDCPGVDQRKCARAERDGSVDLARILKTVCAASENYRPVDLTRVGDVEARRLIWGFAGRIFVDRGLRGEAILDGDGRSFADVEAERTEEAANVG
jgi:hypothetical protein